MMSRTGSRGEWLTEEALRVWDGTRPRLRRDVMARHQTVLGALGLVAATESLVQPTDWVIDADHHTIVVHLGGRLDRMECEFSAGPSGRVLPERGDIWMIPAACRYAALAQGESAEFVELAVPTVLLGDAPMTARVRHRDDFLSGAAARLSELVRGPGGDLSNMAAHAIGEALQLHLLQRYGHRPARAAARILSAADRAMLADAIRGQPDAAHSIASLAGLVAMDVRRFSGAFRQAFGLSPWQYVLRARLEEAARLLRHSDAPVTDIALATGFATPSHFATAFAHRFGVAPSRWRAAG